MGFFDLKFIIIILLTIIIYFLYYEIINIKNKVDNLYDLYTNKNIKKIDTNTDYKKANTNYIKSDTNYIKSDTDTNYQELNSNTNYQQLNSNTNYQELNINANYQPVNEREDRCFFKTIKIPLDLNSLLNPFQRQNNNTVIELASSDIEEITENINVEEITENNYIEEVIKNNYIEEVVENNNIIKLDTINETSEINSVNSKINSENSSKRNSENSNKINLETCNKEEIILNEESTDMKSYVSSSHIEVYSNDEKLSISTKDTVDTKDTKDINNINNQNVDYTNILKNLNKYKLPELQDLAIQFKLPKENNNKKKTRLELIEEIKNYIINKNI